LQSQDWQNPLRSFPIRSSNKCKYDRNLQNHQKLEKVSLPAFVHFAMVKAKLHYAFDYQRQGEKRHDYRRHPAEFVNFLAHRLYPTLVHFELHHLPDLDV